MRLFRKVFYIIIVMCMTLSICTSNVYTKPNTKSYQVKGRQIIIAGHKGTFTGWISNNKANGYGKFTFKYKNYWVDFIGNWNNNKLVKQATQIIYDKESKIIKKGVFDSKYLLQGYGIEQIYLNNQIASMYAGGFRNSVYNGYGDNKYFIDGTTQHEKGMYKNGEFYGAKLQQDLEYESGLRLNITGVYKTNDGIIAFVDVTNGTDDDIMFNTSLSKMIANGYQYEWNLEKNEDIRNERNVDLADVSEDISQGATKTLRILFPYVNATACDLIFNINFETCRIKNMQITPH